MSRSDMIYTYPRRGQKRPQFAFNRDKLPTPLAYYVNLQKMKLIGNGEWRSALCPFHADRTPSLRINVHRGGFRCMVCGAHGGDVLAFHMKHHKLPFIEAAKVFGAWEARP